MVLPGNLSDRFDVLRVLHESPDAAVYCVSDKQSGSGALTLKLVSEPGPDRRNSIAAEYRLLRGIRHPNLTGVREFGHTQSGYWLLRDFVEGPTLKEQGPLLTPEERRAVLLDLLRGLAHLHALGLLHLDIKPQNVLLSRAADGWRGQLCDFGFAEEQTEGAPHIARGTPPFVAPEILLGLEADERTDLFSLGVTLLETGPRAVELDPARLYEHFPGVPFAEALALDLAAIGGDLGQLLLRLLATEPGQRPRSAAAVLQQLEGEADLEPAAFAVLLKPRPAFTGSPAAARLEAFVRRSTRDAVLWLEAPDALEQQEVLDTARFVAALARQALRELSVHGQPAGSGEAALSPEQQRAERTLALARQALEQGGLLLADLRAERQELGRLAAAAARLLSARDPGTARLLVVSTPALAAPIFELLRASCGEPVRLDGLTGDRLRQHLQQLEGRTGQELAASRPRLERLARALLGGSGGHADPIEWILRELLRRGELTWTGSRFDLSRVDPSRLPAVPGLVERLGALDEAELSVLAIADLLEGSPAAIGWERRLPDEQAAACRRLLRDRWLLPGGVRGVRLRTRAAGRAARSVLGAERTSALARRLLDEPLESAPRRALVLSLAGRKTAAVLELGVHRASLAEWEAGDALALLEEIREQCEPDSDEGLTALLILAEHLLQSGHPERARQAFAELLAARPGDIEERLRALKGAATAALVAGEYRRAEQIFRKARSEARQSHAGSQSAQSIERGLAYARFFQGSPEGALRSLQSARRRFTREERGVPVWMHSLIGTFALRAGRPKQARAAFDLGLSAARKAGDPSALAVALANRATLQMGEGDFEAAAAALEEAREIRRVVFHPFEEAAILSNLGMLRRDLGELDRAADLLRESARLRLGLWDRQGHAVALSNLASVEFLQGDLASAEQGLRAAIAEFTLVGATIEAELSRCRLADLFVTAGRQREAELALEELQGDVPNPRARAYAELARGAYLARFGGAEAALRLLASAADGLASIQDQAGSARAQILAAELESTRGELSSARERLARLEGAVPPRLQAAVLLVEGRVAEEGSAGSEAGALFLRAADLARRQGLALCRAEACARAARALSFSEPARAQAAVRDLKATLASVRLPGEDRDETLEVKARALLGTPLATVLAMQDSLTDEPSGVPGGGGQVTTDGIPDEVFRTFVAINRSLAREQELDRLMERLLEQAVFLTGGRRGFLLLLLNGRVVFDARSGEVDATSEEVSRSIVLDTIRERRPLITANARADRRLQNRRSIEQLDLRSVICVPFRSEMGTEGAVYVDNPIREGAFTTRNLDLLEALAGQAAIAMGNLERRREIERLNRQLEQRILSTERQLNEAQRLLRETRHGSTDIVLIGESDPIQSARRLAERFAATDMAVLLLGESGTGKDVFARWIHDHSRRSGSPFVAENCSAVPETLLESEFFGHTKGAFTGADRDHDGLFTQATGGTLFLDEIGDMPRSVQAKLLRVLQEKAVRPVGSLATKPVDVRLICATHRDLEQMVQSGAFREDLYYRIRGAVLRLPPLRDRLEDIPALAGHFLERLNERHDRSRALSDGLLKALMRHGWPGNVRELKTEIIRLFHMADGKLLSPEALELSPLGRSEGHGGSVIEVKPMAEIERDALALALKRTGGNREAAARKLGISRAAFYVKLKKYRLAEEFPAASKQGPS